MPDVSQLRASDADRDAVVSVLQRHYAEGRLELAELSARLELALTAVTRGELAATVADLPDTQAAAPWPPPVARSVSSRRVAAPTPLAPWLLTAVICLLIWASLSLAHGTALYFWPFWVIAPWGAVMLAARATGRSMHGCGRAWHASER